MYQGPELADARPVSGCWKNPSLQKTKIHGPGGHISCPHVKVWGPVGNLPVRNIQHHHQDTDMATHLEARIRYGDTKENAADQSK